VQAALRVHPETAETWEALGAAYEAIGRLTAALKAYERSVELAPRRVYALTQAAAISSMMGNIARAVALLDAADHRSRGHPAVLLGVCQTQTQMAVACARRGATTTAADCVRLAAAAAAAATQRHGTLEAAWKSRGDCHVLAARLPASAAAFSEAGAAAERSSSTAAALAEAHNGRRKAGRAAQHAYAAAVHLNPLRPASWSDLAFTQHLRVTLRALHPPLYDPSHAEHHTRSAERLLLAAVKLSPDVPGFWCALGSVGTTPARCEYALRRSLQLDPSDALAWLKLGRLYHVHGPRDKVAVCPRRRWFCGYRNGSNC
jgi:superkiller protein 3